MQAYSLTKSCYPAKTRRSSSAESAFTLMPCPTNLRAQKAANFVALASADWGPGVLALTASGTVCFVQSRDLERSLDLKVRPQSSTKSAIWTARSAIWTALCLCNAGDYDNPTHSQGPWHSISTES